MIRAVLFTQDLQLERLLQEARAEIAELSMTHRWIHPIEILPVSSLKEAELLCRGGGADLLLADLDTLSVAELEDWLRPDGQASSRPPIVVLTDRAQEPRAWQLVQNGAEALVIKEELDALPLARTCRLSWLNGRRRNGWERLIWVDPLTHCLAWEALLQLGQNYCELAQRVGLDVWAGVVVIVEATGSTHAVDAACLWEAAEAMRSICPPDALMGRSGKRFGLAAVMPDGDATQWMHELVREVHARLVTHLTPQLVLHYGAANRKCCSNHSFAEIMETAVSNCKPYTGGG